MSHDLGFYYFLLSHRKQFAAQTFCLSRQFETFLLCFMSLKHIGEGASVREKETSSNKVAEKAARLLNIRAVKSKD